MRDVQIMDIHLDKSHIVYLMAICAGYEHLVLVRTIDPHKGKVRLLIAPGTHNEVMSILNSLSHDIEWTPWEQWVETPEPTIS